MSTDLRPTAGLEPPADAPPAPGRARPPRRQLPGWLAALDPRGLWSPYGNWPLVLLTILAVVEGFGPRAFALLLPDIQRAFKVNLRFIITIAVWAGTVSLLLSIPGGYLGDRLRRTRLAAAGGLVSAAGEFMTVLVPGKPGLVMGRSVAEVGPSIAPVGFSLVSDYYPHETRGKAFSLRFVGRSLGVVGGVVLAGVMADTLGWRAPFLLAGALGVVVALLVLRLREPIRGYHERLASGADEEIARRQQEPPSFGEAFRAARSVRTLRRIAYSLPFFTAFDLGYAVLFPLYLNRVFLLTATQRAYIAALVAAVGIPGLVIGGNLVDRFVGRHPGRVVAINATVGLVEAIVIPALIFAPSVPVVLVAILPFAFVSAVVRPAYFSVASSVIPPRLRTLGLASIAPFELLGNAILFPILPPLASNYGVRAGLLALVPLAIMGSIIWLTAAPYVEFDIRSATAAAMASEAWRKAKEAGRAKLLVIRDLDVRYEGVQVLFGIDLDVEEGELIALLGTNGAGKSTLLRAISGTQQATGGAIVFDGRDITHVPPHEIARWGVAQTPGGRGIFPGLTVRENLTLAGWLYGDDPVHQEEVERVFQYFPILRERLDQPAGTLSGGEQQMLTLAQAFLARPKLLMIDELSLGLAPNVVQSLLDIIRAIHARGTTIIIVEQSVNVAMTIAQRAVFLEKGEVRFDGPVSELLSRPDILRAVFIKGSRALSGTLVTAGGAARAAPAAPAEAHAVLQVEGLTKSYGGVRAVDGVSFALEEGRVLGFIGPNGAGKTTVLEMISGFILPDEGRVLYEGRDITYLPPEERARLRLIRRFQDARLFPSLTVEETLALALEHQAESRSIVLEAVQAPQARLSEQRIRRRVELLIELLELGPYRNKFVSELSTGTRRVVDIGCVLGAEPRVLLLDEPSSGLAQRETENLGPLLLRVRRELGCSMLVVEHDMPLISSVADELVAMHLGRILVRGRPEDVLEDERVIEAYLGTTVDVIERTGAGARGSRR